MIFDKFFKVPKHKRFEFSPRYYDPQKEELEQCIKAIRHEQSASGEKVKYRLEKHFEKLRTSSFGAKQKQKANLRLAVIIFILAVLCYFLLS